MNNRYLEKVANVFTEALGRGAQSQKLKKMEQFGEGSLPYKVNEGLKTFSQAAHVAADTIEKFAPSTSYGRVKGKYTREALEKQFGKDHAVVKGLDQFEADRAAALANKQDLVESRGFKYNKPSQQGTHPTYDVDFSHGAMQILDPKNIRKTVSAVAPVGTGLNTYVRHIQGGLEGQKALAAQEANAARLKLGLGAAATGAGSMYANNAYQNYKARQQFDDYYGNQ